MGGGTQKKKKYTFAFRDQCVQQHCKTAELTSDLKASLSPKAVIAHLYNHPVIHIWLDGLGMLCCFRTKEGAGKAQDDWASPAAVVSSVPAPSAHPTPSGNVDAERARTLVSADVLSL